MTKLERPALIYWVTRECAADGTLVEGVDVWDRKPTMHADPNSLAIEWRDSAPPGETSIYGRFSPKDLAPWRHALPETGRECIRVEVGTK